MNVRPGSSRMISSRVIPEASAASFMADRARDIMRSISFSLREYVSAYLSRQSPICQISLRDILYITLLATNLLFGEALISISRPLAL